MHFARSHLTHHAGFSTSSCSAQPVHRHTLFAQPVHRHTLLAQPVHHHTLLAQPVHHHTLLCHVGHRYRMVAMNLIDGMYAMPRSLFQPSALKTRRYFANNHSLHVLLQPANIHLCGFDVSFDNVSG